MVAETQKGKTGVTRQVFKGFSSRAEQSNYRQYDFNLIKQNLINRLSVRKGERLEHPEFGTIIYDVLFEPLTESLKTAILEDITENLNADPRLSAGDIRVSQSDHGLQIECSLTYVPYNITEKLRFSFDENSTLRLS